MSLHTRQHPNPRTHTTHPPLALASEVGRTSLALNAAMAAVYPATGHLHTGLEQLASREVVFKKIWETVCGGNTPPPRTLTLTFSQAPPEGLVDSWVAPLPCRRPRACPLPHTAPLPLFGVCDPPLPSPSPSRPCPPPPVPPHPQATDMVEGLAVPLGELDTIRTEIKEDCVTRAHLSAEIEHYSEKLGKLRQGTGEKERAKTEEVGCCLCERRCGPSCAAAAAAAAAAQSWARVGLRGSSEVTPL